MPIADGRLLNSTRPFRILCAEFVEILSINFCKTIIFMIPDVYTAST